MPGDENPIYPGFPWDQAFDLPEGFVQPGDAFYAEFRVRPDDPAALASIQTGSGILVEGDRLFCSLTDEQTPHMPQGVVKTLFVLIRDGKQRPVGGIPEIPVVIPITRPKP